MNTTEKAPAALPGSFLTMWLGQSFSTIGSGMTSFALSIMTYEKHRSLSEFALVVLCYSLPGVLAAGLAGNLLDRYNRKLVLALSALGAAVFTMLIALKSMQGNIPVWYIYMCVAGISFFGAAQAPALNVLTAVLVGKDHYPRANGLWQLSMGLSMIVSPLLAGYLLGKISIVAILVADFSTYFIAIAALVLVRVPAVPIPDYVEKTSAASWRAFIGGWHFVSARPALMQLLLVLGVTHLTLNFMQLAIVPITLNLGDARSLSLIMAVSAVGFMVGATSMAMWGGPKRRIFGVYGGCIVLGVGLMVAGLSSSVAAVAIGMFIVTISLPIAFSCDTAIWQAKTDSGYQGRVFAFTAMVAQAAQPLACLLVSPLVVGIHVLSQSGVLGALGGDAPGRAEGILLAFVGLLVIGLTLLGMSSGRLRRIDLELPDCRTGASIEHSAHPGRGESLTSGA